jgi:hypothetical protein
MNGWYLTMVEAKERREMLENINFDLGMTRIDERAEISERIVCTYAYRYDGRQLVAHLFGKRLAEN